MTEVLQNVANPLEGDLTAFYQPDVALSLPSPHSASFESPDDAKRHIAGMVDRQAADNEIRLTDSAVLRVRSHTFSDGVFTNVYDLSVGVNDVRASVNVTRGLRGVGSVLAGNENAFAAVSGGFLYLVDKSSGSPRQMALNLALQEAGTLASMPVVDREALIADGDGRLSARVVRAWGELTVNGRGLSWAGSRTNHEADALVFGNGNVGVRHHDNHDPGSRKNRIRALDEDTRFTPPLPVGSELVDVGLIAERGGIMQAQEIRPNGGMDIFAYDSVLRCAGRLMTRGVETDIQIRSVDTLLLDRNYNGAISSGPLLSDSDFARNAVNFDPSLGSDPPFYDVRMVRLAIYATANDRLHVRMFDGRPESALFGGVTPTEAVSIIRDEDGEVVWGTFLDPGRTAKICSKNDSTITSYGNVHYLRWPSTANEPYRWVPGAGRPVPSTITLR